MRKWLLIHIPISVILLVLIFRQEVAAALLPAPTSTPTATATHTATASFTPTDTSTPTATDTPTPTATPLPTDTPTPAFTATITPKPSRTALPSPTPEIRGKVLEQANCRYGPGAAYLYEWGLFPDNRVTALGRNQDGSWIYVDPWTYMDKCWVKASLLQWTGDLSNLPQIRTLLPYTEFYWAPRNVSATRDGDKVQVWWERVPMSQDDDRGYLIEAWVCQDRQLVFTPLHFDGPPGTVIDEAGCLVPSSARIYTAEKHGYTQWVLIPWPSYPTPTASSTDEG